MQKKRINNDQFTEIAGNDHFILKGSQKNHIAGNVSLHIEGDEKTKVNGNAVHESTLQTYFVSGGKIVLDAGTEITLKVGESFIRITPNMIFTSNNLVVGGGSAGSGTSIDLELPQGVPPLELSPYPVKKYCAVAAQHSGGIIIKPNEDE